MPPINRAALLRECRRLNRAEMTLWLQSAAGGRITSAEFDRIMRKHLPLEPCFQSEVMTFIRGNYPGAFLWKAAAGPYCRQGIPDICAVIDGRFFGFEIKRPYIGRLSPLQQRTILDIQAAGGAADVISFGTQAKEIIDRVRKQT